jgi:hypothetical protein
MAPICSRWAASILVCGRKMISMAFFSTKIQQSVVFVHTATSFHVVY